VPTLCFAGDETSDARRFGRLIEVEGLDEGIALIRAEDRPECPPDVGPRWVSGS
jgi:hypothetical protein